MGYTEELKELFRKQFALWKRRGIKAVLGELIIIGIVVVAAFLILLVIGYLRPQPPAYPTYW